MQYMQFLQIFIFIERNVAILPGVAIREKNVYCNLGSQHHDIKVWLM